MQLETRPVHNINNVCVIIYVFALNLQNKIIKYHNCVECMLNFSLLFVFVNRYTVDCIEPHSVVRTYYCIDKFEHYYAKYPRQLI